MFFNRGAPKKGKKIIENLFFFHETQMLDCNQYIIKNDQKDELVIFDAGNGLSLDGLIDGMKKLNLSYEDITSVYLTHEHVDHVVGIYPLLEKMENDPPTIFAFGETAKIIREGDQSKIIPGNLGISPKMFGINIKPLDVVELDLENPVKIGNDFSFKIYHTPGHSLGSITYYEPNLKILIPGDLVFTGGSFGRYDFPGGSLKKLQESIEYVNNLDVTHLLPGHMGVSNKGNEQIKHSNRMVHSVGGFF
ncbi:MAG: MBL fold metallo-hydrolase [Candidatus Lokiarchaeota archaeon]|nr:MBL fold metallo-hydrolase [Candidatus Lokiarchaeota archaeon]MBD3199548.1 MBL fold metallo-hydrolase [Candidatus Lokiarchaeota archaeon]